MMISIARTVIRSRDPRVVDSHEIALDRLIQVVDAFRQEAISSGDMNQYHEGIELAVCQYVSCIQSLALMSKMQTGGSIR